MQLTNAISVVDELQSERDSVSAASDLSHMERLFCDVFVANGGNGEEAAREAGYSATSAKVSACRLLCRKRVQDRIAHLCKAFITTQAPVAIRAVAQAVQDEKALWKDRLKAATCLLDRAGMSAPKDGPTINVGVQVNGQQAQQLLTEVWTTRQRRLSDIPPAMPDRLQRDLDDLERLTIDAPALVPGGVDLQGSRAGAGPVPAPSCAKPQKRVVSCECPLCRDVVVVEDDLAAMDEFRAAFDEGEE